MSAAFVMLSADRFYPEKQPHLGFLPLVAYNYEEETRCERCSPEKTQGGLSSGATLIYRQQRCGQIPRSLQ